MLMFGISLYMEWYMVLNHNNIITEWYYLISIILCEWYIIFGPRRAGGTPASPPSESLVLPPGEMPIGMFVG